MKKGTTLFALVFTIVLSFTTIVSANAGQGNIISIYDYVVAGLEYHNNA